MLCEGCGCKMHEGYRFTDWYNDSYDEYGTLAECKKMFKEAIKEDKTGRYSIYDVSICENCDNQHDVGIIYNDDCPDYKLD